MQERDPGARQAAGWTLNDGYLEEQTGVAQKPACASYAPASHPSTALMSRRKCGEEVEREASLQGEITENFRPR